MVVLQMTTPVFLVAPLALHLHDLLPLLPALLPLLPLLLPLLPVLLLLAHHALAYDLLVVVLTRVSDPLRRVNQPLILAMRAVAARAVVKPLRQSPRRVP